MLSKLKKNAELILKKAETERSLAQDKTALFTEYKPKPGGQADFWEVVPFGNEERSLPMDIEQRVVYLRGGIGSGKSFCGAAFACTRAYYDPVSRGLITANEYGQLETSTLVALAEFCEMFNIPLSPRGETAEETARAIASRRLCQIFDASVLVLSANKFGGTTAKAKQGGRGLQVRWFWGDEWSYADEVAFNTVNGRLGRGNGKLKGLGLITSSININKPYNWTWKLFDDPDRSPDKKQLYISINCLTSDNDSLSEDYVRSLQSSYTEELKRIELLGEYAVTVEGLVFKYFKRDRHSRPTAYDSKYPLHISFDFNRSPATALIAQTYNNQIFILEEIYLLNSDTFELSTKMSDRLTQLNPSTIYIYGDASGKAMTANSQNSNWAIVHNSLSKFRSIKKYGESNPPVLDTINSCNCLFNQDRIVVDPSCKELIKDFEFLKDDGKQGIDKKSDSARSHLGDCFRYLCHTLFPYKSDRASPIFVGGKLKNPFKST